MPGRNPPKPGRPNPCSQVQRKSAYEPPPKPGPPIPPTKSRTGLFPGNLQKGDLLMLAILYLLLSEEDDQLLPLLAVGLYLFIK